MGEDVPNQSEAERKLNEAKEAFSTAIFQNDILYAAIRAESARLANLDEGQQLPDFKVEPWRPVSKIDGKQKVGIRLTQSATNQDEEFSELSVDFGLYGYVSITEVDLSTGEGTMSDEVKSHGTPEEQSKALYYFWEAYMAFLKAVAYGEDGNRSADITVDPHSGTFDTIERLQRVVYQSDLEREA